MQQEDKTQAEMSLTSLQTLLVTLSEQSTVRTSAVEIIRDNVSGVNSFYEKYEKAERDKQNLFKTLVQNTSVIGDLSLEYFSSIQNFLDKAFKLEGSVFYPRWMVQEKMIEKTNAFFTTVTEIKDLLYDVADMMGIDKKLDNDKAVLDAGTRVENPLTRKENFSSLGLMQQIHDSMLTTREVVVNTIRGSFYGLEIFTREMADMTVKKFDDMISAVKSISVQSPGKEKEKENDGGLSLSDIKNFKLPNPADIIKLVTSLSGIAKIVKPAFNKAMAVLNSNLDVMLTKVDEKRVDTFVTGIDKMTDVLNKLKDVTKPLALGLTLLSASMFLLTLVPLSPTFIATMGLFVGLTWALSRVLGDRQLPAGMQQFGIGIAAMTAGLLLLNFVNYESIFKMVGFVWLLGYALRSYQQDKTYPDMIKFGASIGIMTAALVMMNFVEWKSVIMLPSFVFLLGASLRAFKGDNGGKELLNISYGIGILTLSLVAMQMVDWTAPALLLGFVASLLFVVGMFNRKGAGAGGKMGMTPITSFAFGIGILTLSLFALQEVEWNTVWKAVVFVGLIAAITKFGAGNRTRGMIGFATGLGILTLSMFAMRELDFEVLTKTVLFVGGLGLALRLFPKTGVPMMLAIAGGIGIMALSLLVFKKSGFTWEDGLTFVGTIAALAAVVALVGLAAPVTALGSGIMIVMGVAAAIFAGSLYLINKMEIDKSRIDSFGEMIIGLSMAYFRATPYIVLGMVGATLFLPVAATSIVSAGALMAVSALTITPENIDNFAYAIKSISLGYAKALPAILLGVVSSALFLPVAAIALATAGVLHLIGKADIKQQQLDAFNVGMKSIVDSVNQFSIIQLGKVMVKSKELLPLMELSLKMSQTMKNLSDSKVSPSDMASFADTISTYVDTMSKTINDSVSKIKGAKEGIDAIAKLTGIAYTLADTVQKMANMEIVEHEEKDGVLVVKKVRKFDFKNGEMALIATNIGKMVSALAEPLVQLASQSDEMIIGGVRVKNPFSKKNKKSLEFIEQIGKTYQPLVDSFNTLAQLEMTRDPKLLTQFKTTMLETTDTLAIVFSKLLAMKTNDTMPMLVENVTSFVKSFSGAKDINEFNTRIDKTLSILSDNTRWNRVTGNLDKVAVRVDRIVKSVGNLNMDKMAAFERNLKLLLEKNSSDKLVELLEKLLELMGMIKDQQDGNGETFRSTPSTSNQTVVVQQPTPVQTSNSKLDELIGIVANGIQEITSELNGTNARLAGTLRVKNVDGSPSNSLR